MGRRTQVILVVALASRAGAAPAFDLDVPAGDARIHAHVVGSDEARRTVVVVHGGPGLTYDYLLPLARLADLGRRVVFYDQRGAGRSLRPLDREYGLAAQVADLDAVRRAVGADKIELVGHSWGTVVALAYAAAHPDEVAAVVLIGMGAPTDDEDRRSFGASFAARKAALVKAGLVPRSRPPPRGDDCMPAFAAVMPAHFADARHPGARSLPGSYHCDVGRATLQAASGWDFTSDLRGLSSPILLVTGDADSNYLGVKETAALIDPDFLVRADLAACGHFPWIECPTPFYAVLERFLTQLRRP
jgi:pimeloyl-ACP methyl ester carboxylesterase